MFTKAKLEIFVKRLNKGDLYPGELNQFFDDLSIFPQSGEAGITVHNLESYRIGYIGMMEPGWDQEKDPGVYPLRAIINLGEMGFSVRVVWCVKSRFLKLKRSKLYVGTYRPDSLEDVVRYLNKLKDKQKDSI